MVAEVNANCDRFGRDILAGSNPWEERVRRESPEVVISLRRVAKLVAHQLVESGIPSA
jgi:hypothetical protein